MRTKKILHEVQKNDNEKIICSIVTNGKEDYIDIREYFYSDEEQQYIPTKKGLCIKPSIYEEIVNNIKF